MDFAQLMLRSDLFYAPVYGVAVAVLCWMYALQYGVYTRIFVKGAIWPLQYLCEAGRLLCKHAIVTTVIVLAPSTWHWSQGVHSHAFVVGTVSSIFALVMVLLCRQELRALCRKVLHARQLVPPRLAWRHLIASRPCL